MQEIKKSSLLLEIPVPFCVLEGVLNIEVQAYNGIQCWLDNFDHVSVCAIVVDKPTNPLVFYRPATPLLLNKNLTLYPLPNGYTFIEHFRHKKQVENLFRKLISEHEYLCFSNLGWWGAWGSVASQIALKSNRPYSVWLDYVLHQMPISSTRNPVRNLLRLIKSKYANKISLDSVKHSSLGLFHGQTVFNAYSPYCSVARLVHDVHMKKENIIDLKQFETRFERKEKILRLGYVGRVHPMKGPHDWIKVAQGVSSRVGDSIVVQATWLGAGPMLDECKSSVADQPFINFPGMESDRNRVLSFLRNLDIFAFTHLTPESPRCLIESLMSGVPIVGYTSEYAEELTSKHGGGSYAAMGNIEDLTNLIIDIASNKDKLVQLSRDALSSGAEFSDEVVFRHRSDLIKLHLLANEKNEPKVSTGVGSF